QAGAVREFGGALGGFVEVSSNCDLGRLRLAGTAHLEQIPAPGRDPLDVIAAVGASYRLSSAVRAGVEYVAQDLEGLAGDDEDEAEGGIRQLVGPNLALALDRDRVVLTTGLALALDRTGQAGTLGRAALTVRY